MIHLCFYLLRSFCILIVTDRFQPGIFICLWIGFNKQDEKTNYPDLSLLHPPVTINEAPSFFLIISLATYNNKKLPSCMAMPVVAASWFKSYI